MISYKFRLYPANEQKILINKTFECTRLVYNIMLCKAKEDIKLKEFNLNKEIPELIKEK